MWRRLLVFGFVFMSVCGCLAQQPEASQNLPGNLPSVPPSSIRIGPGDQIDLNVFNVPEMMQRQRVDENGNYTVPLIGMVHLAGLSVDKAQLLIASKLEEGKFVRGASVSLFISDFATQGVSVTGEVNKPGVYPVWGERHLVDMIAQAGGTTARAGKFASITHRDNIGGSTAYDLSKGDIQGFASNPIVVAGDTVMVGKTGIVYVLGEVGRPGGFPLDNTESLSLIQVLALAQGTTKTAKLGSARLIRKAANGRTEIAVNLKEVFKGRNPDIQLKEDDIIYVPNSVPKTIADRTLPQIIAGTTTAAIYTGLR